MAVRDGPGLPERTYFSSYPSVFLTSIVAELKIDAPCSDEMLHNVHCLRAPVSAKKKDLMLPGLGEEDSS